MKLFSFLFVTTALLFFSCKPETKPIPPQYSDYIGVWTGADLNEVVINADGTGSLVWIRKAESGSSASKKMGSASIEIGESTITFKTLMGISMELNVDMKPSKTDETWMMTLDGVEFAKQ